jgi:hypothetical protein
MNVGNSKPSAGYLTGVKRSLFSAAVHGPKQQQDDRDSKSESPRRSMCSASLTSLESTGAFLGENSSELAEADGGQQEQISGKKHGTNYPSIVHIIAGRNGIVHRLRRKNGLRSIVPNDVQ